MLEINWAAVAIFISILGALMAMAVAWGTFRERLNQTVIDIDKDRKQNREDHQTIFSKLDALRDLIAEYESDSHGTR